MERTGSTKERKARALSVLSNGPWPVDFTWGLFHDRHTDLAQINALRTLRSLAKEGKVERHIDSSGCENWRLL